MPDFHINVPVVHQIVELIMLHDALREGSEGDPHVCIILLRHWGAQVEVLEVAHHASSIWGGQDAVEKEFSGDEVGGFGADVAVILNLVTANGPAHMVWYHFFGVVCTHNAKIGCLFVVWDG